MSEGEGFAIDEYIAPRCGQAHVVAGGTIPKGSNAHGGCFEHVNNKHKQVPGPEHYNKDHLNVNFNSKAKGGGFSKLDRQFLKTQPKAPAVGQYETENALVSPRIRGGMMNKRDRGCFFYDIAVKQGKWCPCPGKYDGVPMPRKVIVPNFTSTKTESRVPTKQPPVGPGYYELNRIAVEPSSISYSAPKEVTKSDIDRICARTAKLPAPGHNGIPESKVEDRAGRRMHTQRLLGDRLLMPRVRTDGQAAPSSARSAPGGADVAPPSPLASEPPASAR